MESAYVWLKKDCSNMEWAPDGRQIPEETLAEASRLRANMEHLRQLVPMMAGAPGVEDPMKE